MGSSGKGTNDKSIDTSAGALVWVRRRNGSWWPARVVGPEELPEDCVISEKLGTPFKLLGKDAAAVEWHNVEKSKRVKAFRCGQFVGCIAKAKKAAASGTKKVVKYARREDAILQALDIEKASMEKDALEFSSGDGDKKDEEMQDCEKTHASLHAQEDAKASPDEAQMIFPKDEPVSVSESELELSHSRVTFEEKSQVSAEKEGFAEGKQLKNPNDSEEDGAGGIKRMRGLGDLGLGAALSFKRKRSPVAIVQEYLKKKSRRRTITKVLETTPMVSVPVLGEQPGSPPSKISEVAANGLKKISSSEDSTLVKCTQKKNTTSSGELGCHENGSSDHLFDVPLVAEEKQLAGAPKRSPSSQVENVPLGNDELIESGSASSGAGVVNNLNNMLEKGPSKWRLKGKRKARHSSNRSKRQEDEGPGPHLRAIEQNVLSLRSGRKVDYNNSTGGAHPPKPRTVADIQAQNRSLPFRMSRFVLNPKYNSADFSLRHHLTDNTLYDVNVEVKGSYRPQHVPYISLMSKLNGRPIVGHPLTVEAVEEGFTDQLFSSSDMEDDHPEDPFVLQSFDMVYKRRSGKPPKPRKNIALSKKIRRLSTLTSHKKGGSGSFDKKPVIENLKGPAIACVPVKVVFSRIKADLKG